MEEEELRRILDGEEGIDRDGDPYAKLEQGFSYESMAEEETPRLNPPVRVTFYHYRKRLIDPDNLCTKGALDQVVRSGILTDDTAQQVQEIRHRQVKSNTEKTFILLEEID